MSQRRHKKPNAKGSSIGEGNSERCWVTSTGKCLRIFGLGLGSSSSSGARGSGLESGSSEGKEVDLQLNKSTEEFVTKLGDQMYVFTVRKRFKLLKETTRNQSIKFM